MHRYFPLVFILVLITACNQFWLSGILDKADEVEIRIYSKGDSTTRPITITTVIDKDEVKKIGGFISEEKTPAYKCGYDGTLKFKSKGQVLIDAEFNLQPDCSHVAFVLNNKVNYRKLTDEGYGYLLDILKKQSAQ